MVENTTILFLQTPSGWGEGGGVREEFTRDPESETSCSAAKGDSEPCHWVGIKRQERCPLLDVASR